MAPDDPLTRFLSLFAEAKKAYPDDWNAMTLSTVDAAGRPSNRVVLLKGAEEAGFVFYTNYESRKGRELAHNPYAALCFYWARLESQVRVEGICERVSSEESDAYFASRPRGSQLGAWASKQSEALGNRDSLEQRVMELAKQYEGVEVPRPPFWGGFRLAPDRIEFWKNRMSRLHDREVYFRKRISDPWHFERLYP